MARVENVRREESNLSAWNIAAAFGLLAVAFVIDRGAPPSDDASPMPPQEKRDASAAGLAMESGDHGRHATSPSEIPAKGWKDILLRVYSNIGRHRILALAAGMTYYSILAIFPALAALVAIYGFFSDPGSIAKHLDDISGFVPGGAIEIAREQLTRVATKGDRTLGLTFLVGLLISLWSANAAMKALFDTLNIVYGEQEKRGFVKLNAISLSFTLAAIAFVLIALGAVVAVPVILNLHVVVQHRRARRSLGEMASSIRRSCARLGISLPLRAQSRGPALEMAHMGQHRGHAALASCLRAFLLLCGQLRHFQPNLRVAWCGDRLHDMALDLGHRDPAGSGAERRDGAPNGARHDDRRAGATWCPGRPNGRYGRSDQGRMTMTNLLKLPTWADDEHIHAVVETSRGSTCKLEFDPDLKVFTLAKPLMTGLAYPYDWGFIPSTKAEDGDPLDVLIIHDAQTFPGVVLRCRPVGILEVEQKSKGKKERNDRVFAVPERSPLETDLEDVRNLPGRAREELEQFFRATNALEDKQIDFLGWRGPGQAIKTIKRLSVR
ncbi:inorganic pyrophosphatase [Bradyrhizobium sp. i1.3.6]